VCALLAFTPAQAQDDGPLRVLFIGAHPDDCDVKAGGTAALMAQQGHAVKFVSLTNGDAGHHEMGGGVLADRRRAESKEAARRLGIDAYDVLDYHDGELMPTLNVRKDVIRLIRDWDADVVIGPRPNDYHPDHRYTGRVVQDAAYMVQVPNVVSRAEPTSSNPVFLYFQDRFQKPYPFQHDITVAVDEALDQKMDALDAHESQFYEWLPWISGRLDEVPEGDEARKQWLREQWTRPVSDAARESLTRWYGADAAQDAQHTESFEIAEYGHQPSEDEIRRLFPMLAR
jgi:LmbE family N-acetylglucosaminyl deacetylase